MPPVIGYGFLGFAGALYVTAGVVGLRGRRARHLHDVEHLYRQRETERVVQVRMDVERAERNARGLIALWDRFSTNDGKSDARLIDAGRQAVARFMKATPDADFQTFLNSDPDYIALRKLLPRTYAEDYGGTPISRVIRAPSAYADRYPVKVQQFLDDLDQLERKTRQ